MEMDKNVQASVQFSLVSCSVNCNCFLSVHERIEGHTVGKRLCRTKDVQENLCTQRDDFFAGCLNVFAVSR